MREVELLVVSHTHGLWGAQMRLVEYLPYLLDAGVVPTLLVPREGPFADAFAEAGCDVRVVDLGERIGLRDENDGRPGPAALARQLRELGASAMRLRPLVREFDLVQSHSRTAHVEVAAAARLARRPCVLDVHDVVRPGLGRRVLALAGRLATTVLANSSSTAATLGRRARNVVVVNPAVDLGRFTGTVPRDDEVRAELGGRPGRILVGVVGRIDADKRIELLIDAVAALGRDDVDLTIVGATHIADDGYLDELRARADERLPGRVGFPGARRDMPRVMAALDVLASACTVEAFGRSILEAQASRIPVVAPDLLGVSDIVVAGSTGWLFRPERADDLARALDDLLTSPHRDRIVETAFEQASHLGIEQQSQVLTGLYRGLAAGAAEGRG